MNPNFFFKEVQLVREFRSHFHLNLACEYIHQIAGALQYLFDQSACLIFTTHCSYRRISTESARKRNSRLLFHRKFKIPHLALTLVSAFVPGKKDFRHTFYGLVDFKKKGTAKHSSKMYHFVLQNLKIKNNTHESIR